MKSGVTFHFYCSFLLWCYYHARMQLQKLMFLLWSHFCLLKTLECVLHMAGTNVRSKHLEMTLWLCSVLTPLYLFQNQPISTYWPRMFEELQPGENYKTLDLSAKGETVLIDFAKSNCDMFDAVDLYLNDSIKLPIEEFNQFLSTVWNKPLVHSNIFRCCSAAIRWRWMFTATCWFDSLATKLFPERDISTKQSQTTLQSKAMSIMWKMLSDQAQENKALVTDSSCCGMPDCNLTDFSSSLLLSNKSSEAFCFLSALKLTHCFLFVLLSYCAFRNNLVYSLVYVAIAAFAANVPSWATAALRTNSLRIFYVEIYSALHSATDNRKRELLLSINIPHAKIFWNKDCQSN